MLQSEIKSETSGSSLNYPVVQECLLTFIILKKRNVQLIQLDIFSNNTTVYQTSITDIMYKSLQVNKLHWNRVIPVQGF